MVVIIRFRKIHPKGKGSAFEHGPFLLFTHVGGLKDAVAHAEGAGLSQGKLILQSEIERRNPCITEEKQSQSVL